MFMNMFKNEDAASRNIAGVNSQETPSISPLSTSDLPSYYRPGSSSQRITLTSGFSHYDVAFLGVGLPGTLRTPITDLERAAECVLTLSPSFLVNIDDEAGFAEALLVRLDFIDQARTDGVWDRPGVRPASSVFAWWW